MQQMPCGFRSLLMMGCLWAGRQTAEWAGWPPGASCTRGEGQDVWETIRALLQFSCHKWYSGSGLDSAPAQTQCRFGCQGHKRPNSSSDNRKVCSCKTKKKAINCEYAKTVHWFESRTQWMVVVLCFCLSHMPITLWWGLDKHQRKDGRKITQATECVAYGVCGYVCVCVLCVFWRI